MSDEQRPRPRYGEYAPGHAPGEQPPEPAVPADGPPPAAASDHPVDPPSTAHPGQPWNPSPPAQPSQQWAPPPAVPTAAPWTSDGGGYVAPVKKRSTVDLVFTIVLLVLGLIGTLAAFGYAAIFSDPQLLDDAMRQQGRDGFDGSIGSAPAILMISHGLLYLVAVGLSILSLLRKRITFWIPLSIGVVAAVIFWATVISVLLSDPSMSQQPGL